MARNRDSIGRHHWRQLTWLVWPLAGAIFLYAGLRHEENPFGFFQSIVAYRIVPIWLATLTAGYLPFLEVLVGCCLIFGVLDSGAVPLAGVLTGAFFLITLSAKMRNLNIDCGCFGGTESSITWIHVVANFVASAGLFASAKWTRRRPMPALANLEIKN